MRAPFKENQVGVDQNQIGTEMNLGTLERQRAEAVDLSDSKDDLQHDCEGYKLDVDVRDADVQTTTTELIRRQKRLEGVVLLETKELRCQRANRDHLQSQKLDVARPSKFHASEEYMADMVKRLVKENKWRKKK